MGRVLFTGFIAVPLCQCPQGRQEVRSSGRWSPCLFQETGHAHTLPVTPTQVLPFSGDQLEGQRLEMEEEGGRERKRDRREEEREGGRKREKEG
jgi:hypothetical protein